MGDPWEPGIPRVQVILYQDADENRVIDDLDEDGAVTLADVDNHPLGWADGTASKGPEDIDHDGDGVFDPGDALQIAWTDSWDDVADGNPTLGAMQTNPPVILGKPIVGADNYGTWNQVTDAVFDGGYAFTSYVPGGIASGADEVSPLPTGAYIVQAVPPPGYKIQTEESMNVGFGDAYQPSKLWLPPEVVGTPGERCAAPYRAGRADPVPRGAGTRCRSAAATGRPQVADSVQRQQRRLRLSHVHRGAAIDQRRDGVSVKVIDNGKGFDADARTAAVGGEAGIDLFDIRTRLRPFGGTLSIQSEPGTGTRAYIRVPTAPALEAMPVPRQARGRPA